MKTILLLLSPIMVISGCIKPPFRPPKGEKFDSEKEYNNFDYRRQKSAKYQREY